MGFHQGFLIGGGGAAFLDGNVHGFDSRVGGRVIVRRDESNRGRSPIDLWGASTWKRVRSLRPNRTFGRSDEPQAVETCFVVCGLGGPAEARA